MIAIATGRGDLDEAIKESLPEGYIVNYREFLLKNDDSYQFNIVILSMHLKGTTIDMEELLFTLKQNGTRVIYLTNKDFTEEIKMCLQMNIYDLLFDPLTVEKIINVIENPMEFKDISDLYVKVINDESIEKEKVSLKGSLINKLKGVGDNSEDNIQIIEKEVIVPGKEYIIKEMDKAYISIYSACSTGKSHTAWNLSYCLGKLDYKTTVINLDYGYSANILYGIEEIYFDVLDTIIEKNLYKDILEYAWKKGNVNIIAKALGNTEELDIESYRKLLYYIRPKDDVVIADCRSGHSELLEQIIRDTNIDLLIFDMDLTHYQLNKQLVEQLGDLFNPEKTIAVINNCNVNSNAYKYIRKKILDISNNFKDILPITSCSDLSYELMDTGKFPYKEAEGKEEYKQFILDMDAILNCIKARSKQNNNLFIKSYNYIKSILKKER